MKEALAVFDFDGTLRKGDSIIEYLRFAEKIYPHSVGLSFVRTLFATLWWRLGGMSDEKAKSVALSFLKKLSKAQRDTLDTRFAKEVLLPAIYQKGREEMKKQKAAGRTVVLCSASPECYMKKLQQLLPETDAVLASLQNESGQVMRNCVRQEKVRRITERFPDMDAAASYAYGDSGNDYDMLRFCGHPVCVNAKKKLSKKADAAWTRMDFKGNE